MQEIQNQFGIVCKLYNSEKPHADEAIKLVRLCLTKLHRDASVETGWDCVVAKQQVVNYGVWRPVDTFHQGAVSRPWLTRLLPSTSDHDKVERLALEILRSRQPLNTRATAEVTDYIYIAVMSLACCYDLWKPGSRKTPGTFFEVFMAALLRMHFARHRISKHVNLGTLLRANGPTADLAAVEAEWEAEKEEKDTLVPDATDTKASLSTDLVITSDVNGRSAILPLKITTRERIVQPFAHQRILEAADPGQHRSFICCISETQLDKKTRNNSTIGSVKQVCVPGTIKLFQRFLAPVEGLYYCDTPIRYSRADLTSHVPVKKLGEVFADVRTLLES